jgi:pSer/pThr/pTyr-binding forkhead associated (FHA) protein
VPESVLTVLKFCFLALLYLFLYRVVRVVMKEMRAPAPSPIVDAGFAPAAAPAMPAAQPAKTRGRAPGHLRIVEPPDRRGETVPVANELTVGRGGGCGVVLADDTFVSTVHARVYRRDGDVWVEDLGSRNGTLLNGAALTVAQPLRRGDQLQFGRTVIEATR